MSDLASNLLGQTINGKYLVVEKRIKDADDNSGAFSSGYVVESLEDGNRYFLKAFNLLYALQQTRGKTLMEVMDEMSNDYEHEKDLGDLCRDSDLNRVVAPVDFGEHGDVSNPLSTVSYLIFEMSEKGSLKKVTVKDPVSSLGWRMMILHGAFMAVEQLHRASIVHQDIKQSNILIFGESFASIADLGCAKIKGKDYGRENGDGAVAPIEYFYGHFLPDFDERRVAGDLFMLGLLYAKTLIGRDLKSELIARTPPNFRSRHFLHGTFGGIYPQALPALDQAFEQTLKDITPDFDKLIREKSIKLLRELCHPDPMKRGTPPNVLSSEHRLSLRRYISMLGNLWPRANLI